MTPSLTLSLSALTIAAVAFAGVQSTRLSNAHSSLATATTRLTEAQTERDQAVRDRARSVTALTRERDRAVTAERRASSLLEQIARDAGTDRDGETAPVLKEALEGLSRTAFAGEGSNVVFGPTWGSPSSPRPRFVAERQDALFNGRRPDVWRLFVIRDGRVITIATYVEKVDCMEAARDRAIASIVLPVPDSIKIHCAFSRPEERA